MQREKLLALVVFQNLKYFSTLSLMPNGLKHTLSVCTYFTGTSLKLNIYRLRFHFDLLAALSTLTLLSLCLIIHYQPL